MSPMKSLQYFEPMEHKPLKSISNYALATDKKGAEHMVIIKPKGLDIYISNGQIFDFEQRELTNTFLRFTLENALNASEASKGVYVGVLCSTDTYFEKKIPRLYDSKPVSFKDLFFVVYDVVFPLFEADVVFRWRYDVAAKVIGKLSNCLPAKTKVIRNSSELIKVVSETFKQDITTTMIVYKMEGKHICGKSQLWFLNEDDVVSYKIVAEQRFRAHIKTIHSITDFLPNGDKYETAEYITIKYKHDFIDIVLPDNKVLCKSIWDYRKVLKPIPFWFTGYDIWENNEYKTLVNTFHSFIL
jgi:hypothetical protein